MSFQFTASESDYMETAAAVSSGGSGITLAAWIKQAAISDCAMLSVGSTTTDAAYILKLNGSGAVQFGIQDVDTNFAFATSSVTITTNTWYFACGKETANNSRSVFVNGANKVTNTTTRGAMTGLNRTAIGAWHHTNSQIAHFNGLIAYAYIFDSALDDATIAALALAGPPTGSPAGYWTLTTNESPIQDQTAGNNDMTNNGATFSTDNPTFATAARRMMLLGVG